MTSFKSHEKFRHVTSQQVTLRHIKLRYVTLSYTIIQYFPFVKNQEPTNACFCEVAFVAFKWKSYSPAVTIRWYKCE